MLPRSRLVHGEIRLGRRHTQHVKLLLHRRAQQPTQQALLATRRARALLPLGVAALPHPPLYHATLLPNRRAQHRVLRLDGVHSQRATHPDKLCVPLQLPPRPSEHALRLQPSSVNALSPGQRGAFALF